MKLSVSLSTLAVSQAFTIEQTSVSRPLFCYYTNWSQYRPGNGQFWPEDIPADLCTNVIFSFGYVENTTNGWGVVPFEWNDQDSSWNEGLYSRINNLRRQNPSLKTHLAIGGWNHGNQPWVQMVATDQGIRDFSRNSLQYVKDHGFDGLDLDWEYPGKCTVDCSPEGDVAKFKQLYRQIRSDIETNPAFRGLMLTVAVGIGQDKVLTGADGALPSYEPADLTDYFDWVHLMSYDMHGHWEDKTGHQAALYKYTPDERTNYTTNYDWILDTWINELGANPAKMSLGLPTYGQTFKLKNPSTDHGMLAEAEGPNEQGLYSGSEGSITRTPGFLAYYEICEKLAGGWTSEWVDEIQAPYAHGDGDWVAYDNERSIRAKVQLAKQYGLGGIMNWAIDIDDFKGQFCGQGPYPLLNAAKTEWNIATSSSTTSSPSSSSSSSSTSESITSSSTSSSSSTSDSPPAGSCTHGSNSPHPNDCEKYYLCANDSLIENTCPSGLYYDTSISQCNWSQSVDCCNGQRPCDELF